MVLIISEKTDQSTYEVVKWLKYYNTPYTIVLPNDKIYIRKIDFEDDFFILEIENKIFNSKDIQSVWFRRGKLNTFINEIIDQDEISKKLRTFNYGEKFAIEAFVHSFFLKKISVNNSLLQNVNKPKLISESITKLVLIVTFHFNYLFQLKNKFLNL